MDENMMERDFYYVLYTTLLAMCPVDSRNMVDNISLQDMGENWLITVSAPQDEGEGYNYARAVNYGLAAKGGENREARAMTAKELANYMWIERTIEQVSHLFGSEVQYELS